MLTTRFLIDEGVPLKPDATANKSSCVLRSLASSSSGKLIVVVAGPVKGSLVAECNIDAFHGTIVLGSDIIPGLAMACGTESSGSVKAPHVSYAIIECTLCLLMHPKT